MRGDRFGDAFAACQPGSDDLPGIAFVDLGAGRADVLAAVAARDAQDPAGLAGGVIDAGFLAGDPIDGVDAAVQAHGVGAVAGGGELGLPAGEVIAGCELEQISGRCPEFRAVASEVKGGRRDHHGTTTTRNTSAAQARGASSPSADKPRSPFMRADLVRITAAMKGAQGRREVVPSSVELRWRPLDHQAAF